MLQLSSRTKAVLAVCAFCVIVAAGTLRAAPTQAESSAVTGQTEAVNTVTITGQVLLPDGQPVANCRVFTYRWPPNRDPVSIETLSGAAGSFFFTVQRWRSPPFLHIVVTETGLAPDWAILDFGEEAVLRIGAQPTTCSGTVVDAEGNPIRGAEVRIVLLRHADQVDRGRQVLHVPTGSFPDSVTADNGRFAIVGLPEDTWAGLQVKADGWAILYTGLIPFIGRDVQLVMLPETTISGRITYDGQPVANVEVNAHGTGSYGLRAKSVSGPDGSYRLRQLHVGYCYLSIQPPNDFTPTEARVTLAAGQHVTGVDVKLRTGGVIEGTVTEAETGRPVPGLVVSAGNYSRGGITDEAGAYSLRAPAGEKVLHTRGGLERRWESDYWQVEIAEGETLTGVDLVVRASEPQMLRGRVLLPSGKSGAGVEVRLSLISSSGIGEPREPRAFSDGQGRFELPAVTSPLSSNPSRFTIYAHDTERALAAAAVVVGHDGRSVEGIEVRLEPGGFLVGEVVDTQGKPVRDIPVSWHAWTADRGPREESVGVGGIERSDREGRLSIGPLPGGATVSVIPDREVEDHLVDDTWQERQQFTITAGETQELPPVRIDTQGRTVRGWVGDQQQEPAAGALVFGIGNWLYGEVHEPALTDERGYFELTGLPTRGVVPIVAVHPTRPMFAIQELDPDWGFEPGLVLQPAGSVTGRVVDEQGQSVANATVALGSHLVSSRMSPDLRMRLHAAGFITKTYPDEDGRWRVGGIIPGAAYRAFARYPDGDDGNIAVEFAAGPGETVDLGEMVLRKDQ